LSRHAKKELHVFVHGDDFVTLGMLSECRWLREKLAGKWEPKERSEWKRKK
jgi:hypothetical protein